MSRYQAWWERSDLCGGGLGVPLVEGDGPLDLARWGEIIARQVGNRGLVIQAEYILFSEGDF